MTAPVSLADLTRATVAAMAGHDAGALLAAGLITRGEYAALTGQALARRGVCGCDAVGPHRHGVTP